MASITINVPDQHVNRVIHALCVAGVHDEENAANAKATVVAWIKNTVRDIERQEAAQAAAIDTSDVAS